MRGPQDLPIPEKVEQKGTSPITDEVKPDQTVELSIPQFGELEKMHLALELGLGNLRDMHKYQDQIQRLVEWAKLKGATNREDIISEVRKMSARIGSAPFGNNQIQHLSRAAYLEMERMKLDQEIKELEVPSAR